MKTCRRPQKIQYTFFDPELIESVAKKRGFDLETLGDVLGIQGNAIYRKIHRLRPITVEELEKLAQFLGVDVVQFFPYMPRKNIPDWQNTG